MRGYSPLHKKISPLPHSAAECRFPPEERAALLMVGRLTAALPYALRAQMLQAEEVDCYAQPVDLPGDLEVRPCAFVCLF